MMLHCAASVILLVSSVVVQAAPPEPLPSNGALIVVPATGTVRQTNDQATVIMAAEENHKDRALAQSRVNEKMARAMEILRKADPSASLKTESYSTYPIYPEQTTPPTTQPRVPVAWRVSQSVRVTTTNLAALPNTVAAAQAVLTLSTLYFGLAPETLSKLDDQRVAATYLNLDARVRVLARAMGRQPTDVVVEMVDFEGSGNYAERGAPPAPPAPAPMKMLAARTMSVEEPSFEPGETTLHMRAVGKVRFK